MVRQTIKLENYASLCFQLSTDSFFYPVLRCLAPFLQNEKEAEKQFALIQKRILQIAKLHNAQKIKTPADLQKTLLKTTESEKFIKLMIQNKPSLEVELIMLSLCGSLAENGFANQWNFQRKFYEIHAEFEK